MAGVKNQLNIIATLKVGQERTVPQEVPVGARIRGITCNLNWIVPSGSGTSTVEFYIIQLRAGQGTGNIPNADWTDIGLSTVRNQIFHTDMGITGTEDAGAFRRSFYLKIPKKFQRVREGDTWTLVYDITDTMTTAHGFRFKWRL